MKTLKTNIGSCDGGVRFILGCGGLFLGVKFGTWWGLLGIVPIATAATGCCPLYGLFHLDTQAAEDRFEAKHPHPPLEKP